MENGGAGGIRTLDTAFQPYNGLANRRLQPLGHSTALRGRLLSLFLFWLQALSLRKAADPRSFHNYMKTNMISSARGMAGGFPVLIYLRHSGVVPEITKRQFAFALLIGPGFKGRMP